MANITWEFFLYFFPYRDDQVNVAWKCGQVDNEHDKFSVTWFTTTILSLNPMKGNYWK